MSTYFDFAHIFGLKCKIFCIKLAQLNQLWRKVSVALYSVWPTEYADAEQWNLYANTNGTTNNLSRSHNNCRIFNMLHLQQPTPKLRGRGALEHIWSPAISRCGRYQMGCSRGAQSYVHATYSLSERRSEVNVAVRHSFTVGPFGKQSLLRASYQEWRA